ncbi:MAG: ATP-binding protein [Treponema sp.]|jgi:hypothetical protein|nr:ATP-binding protein [Treponema sp.]
MSVRKYPIGIQDFAGIREDNCIYVDKTTQIHRLIAGSGKTFFLSRPRRFGKSLLCSTLAAVFEGRRELFGGLALEQLDWDWKKYPVIRLDLNPGNFGEGVGTLKLFLHNLLQNQAAAAGLELRGSLAPDQFGNLIRDLRQKNGERVAVIIDEYDKPLLTTIQDKDIHEAIRNELKAFYGVLKSSDEFLKFVFLTGVTKFAQVSVFSELNNLMDLTLDPRYADLCGITQEELEGVFAPDIEEAARHRGCGREDYLGELKRFYNGYRFSEKPLTVYNPFGLLKHFESGGRFQPYWFETGTPAFLIRLIENQHIDLTNLENLKVAYNDFRRYDAENLSAVAVLYQTGYLTVSGYDERRQQYTLDYPNDEVRASFADALLGTYIKAPEGEKETLTVKLSEAFEEGDIDGVIGALIPFLASIPYDIQIKQEKYYQTIIHLIFRMLGLRDRSEVRIGAGRIDTLVETEERVYCFEFKLGEGGAERLAEEALEQIGSKEYLLPWEGSGKKLYKVGVAFDYTKRNIGAWRWA